ncbi:MAG: hypothetical protein KAT25_04545 [Sulfuriflexus sp.]|nr:hypothetical protein [Sulfuriflexus sp.]
MEYLNLFFDIIKYFFLGVFGLVAIVIIITIIFGDQVENRWRFKALFYDANNNQIGRFRITLFGYTKKDKPDELKIKFRLKHPQLIPGAMVKVYIEDSLYYENAVTKKGKVSFGKTMDKSEFKGVLQEPELGQLCKVKCSGFIVASAELGEY